LGNKPKMGQKGGDRENGKVMERRWTKCGGNGQEMPENPHARGLTNWKTSSEGNGVKAKGGGHGPRIIFGSPIGREIQLGTSGHRGLSRWGIFKVKYLEWAKSGKELQKEKEKN